MLNTRISVRTSWLRKILLKWSRTGLDSSSSFGQDQCGFCGKLENMSSCTVYKNWKRKMKRINFINLFSLLGDENNFLS